MTAPIQIDTAQPLAGNRAMLDTVHYREGIHAKARLLQRRIDAARRVTSWPASILERKSRALHRIRSAGTNHGLRQFISENRDLLDGEIRFALKHRTPDRLFVRGEG